MRSSVAALVASAAILLPAGCERFDKTARELPPITADTAAYRDLDSPGMRYLPREEEVAGWRLAGDPLVIPAKGLPAYLGSQSGLIIPYDATDLTAGEYERTDGPGFATVQIFRFPDFVKAFGAFSTRRVAFATPLKIGNEAFATRLTIHVWKGPFYIRITGGNEKGQEPMIQLAAAVADEMPPAPGRPAVFGFFPTQNRVPNSDVFSAEPAMGQPFFRNAFLTRYQFDGEDVEAMALPTHGREGAQRALEDFRRFFVVNGRLLDQVPNLGEDNFTAEDRFFGRTAAFRIDRFVVAFRGFADRQLLVDLAVQSDKQILDSIRNQLAKQEERQNQVERERAPGEAPPEPE